MMAGREKIVTKDEVAKAVKEEPTYAKLTLVVRFQIAGDYALGLKEMVEEAGGLVNNAWELGQVERADIELPEGGFVFNLE